MAALDRVSLVLLAMYQFHLLRNLTPLYFVFLGSCLALFLLYFISNLKIIRFEPIGFFVFGCLAYASIISFFYTDSYGDPLIGIFRLWVAAPMILIAIVLARFSIFMSINIIIFVFALAALSYPWQYVFGGIAWFAESSERAGGLRFASLIGSLTAYGGLVGIPMLASMINMRGVLRVIVVSLLFIGALMSLQKAALANVALAFIFAVWLNALSKRLVFYISIMILCIFLLSLTYTLQDGPFSVIFRNILGIITSDSNISSDVGFSDSMWSRLTALPSEALEFFSFDLFFAGTGVFGGSGALGYPELPMAHNGLVEIILIFGLFFGVLFCIGLIYIFLYSIIFLLLKKNNHHLELRFLCCAYIIWVVNFVFSGGGLFQPIAASLLWLVVFRMRMLLKKRDVLNDCLVV